jgi:hypothetical protein
VRRPKRCCSCRWTSPDALRRDELQAASSHKRATGVLPGHPRASMWRNKAEELSRGQKRRGGVDSGRWSHESEGRRRDRRRAIKALGICKERKVVGVGGPKEWTSVIDSGKERHEMIARWKKEVGGGGRVLGTRAEARISSRCGWVGQTEMERARARGKTELWSVWESGGCNSRPS